MRSDAGMKIFYKYFVYVQITPDTQKVDRRLSYIVLFLDRQRLHHLFPSVDHTRLTLLNGIVPHETNTILTLNDRVNRVLS